jgi:hypothetical protein
MEVRLPQLLEITDCQGGLSLAIIVFALLEECLRRNGGGSRFNNVSVDALLRPSTGRSMRSWSFRYVRWIIDV